MGKNETNKKQGDTTKKTATVKHQVTGKTNMDSGEKIVGNVGKLYMVQIHIVTASEKDRIRTREYQPETRVWKSSLQSFKIRHHGTRVS